jgi:hypothetical protein
MKTKSVMPWNLKVGQRLMQFDCLGQLRANKILSIQKKTGRFTGKSMWRVFTDAVDNPLSTFHARLNALPTDKATIKID